MAFQVQSRTDHTIIPFTLDGMALSANNETILQDAGRSAALEPYTVMGHALIAAGSITPGTNTGNGTCTVLALSRTGFAIVGDYNLECTIAVTEGGIFKLEDPNGNIVADNIIMDVGAGLVTNVAVAGLSFILTDGTTDFVAGDSFALEVTALDKWLPLDLTEANGLAIPAGIFMGSSITAASIVAGDVTGQPIMNSGQGVLVNESLVIVEGTTTLDTTLTTGGTVKSELIKLGIIPIETETISRLENA